MLKTAIPAIALLATLSGGAFAADEEKESEGRAYIPFADQRGSIDNWEADGREGIWIEGQNNQWYYAEFMGPCIGLPFQTTIGFETNGVNRIDKFSSILVDGRTCQFKSFEKSDGPPEDED